MKIKNFLSVCTLLVFCVLLLTGCGREKSPSAAPGAREPAAVTPGISVGPEPAETVPAPVAGPADVERYTLERERREEIIAECMKLAELCAGELESAKTAQSEFFPYETVLARETIDVLEELLAGEGYAVMDTDGTYPEYLRNSEGLKAFAQQAAHGEPARQAIVTVTRYGSLGYSLFEQQDGGVRHIFASVSRADDASFAVSEPYMEEVREFGCAGEDFFYYRIYPFDWHWDACVPVRLSPADGELYGMYAKYVMPLGYQGTNVFLVDWSAADWGELSFNDVFEHLYRMRTGEYVDADGIEYSEQLECCLVPAEVFEETVLPYFDISSDELRSRAMYIPDLDAYPWKPVISTEIKYFPTLTPELRARRDNGDGSVTLTVDVLCFDEKCFPLFTHELTVTPGENGEFKYLSNELVYVSEHSRPNASPRLAGKIF